MKTAIPLILLVPFLGGCGGGVDGKPIPPPTTPLLPLSWNDVPEQITMKEGETETFVALLTAAVDATYSFTADSDAVEVSGRKVRTGVFEGSVTGVHHGEYTLTLTATYTGYVTATETVDVVVQDPFDLGLWRELVFDAYDCPTGSRTGKCDKHDGKRVESRAVRVLPFWPSFNIIDPHPLIDFDWLGSFSIRQINEIENAIETAVEQLTGRRFVERITIERLPRDEYGWVDIFPVTDAFWDDDSGTVCGSASVGNTSGAMVLNAARMRSDECPTQALMLHELGHTIGFYHVEDHPDHLMTGYVQSDLEDFSQEERFHALLAQELGRGAPYTSDPRSQVGQSETTGPFVGLPDQEMLICPLRY